MTGFWSYETLLRRTMKLLSDSPLILEWGPGISTLMMLEEKPKAKIHTIEHDYSWAINYSKTFMEKRYKVDLLLIKDEPRYWEHALNLKRLYGEFNLVFVDGTQRVRCLEIANQVVKNDGWVLLHDSEREEYQPGIKLFNIIHEENDTIALVRK